MQGIHILVIVFIVSGVKMRDGGMEIKSLHLLGGGGNANGLDVTFGPVPTSFIGATVT